MAEVVTCSECKKKLRVPDELIGKQVRCPTCGHVFRAEVADAGSSGPAEEEDDSPRTRRVTTRPDGDEERPSRRLRSTEDEDRPRAQPRFEDEEEEEEEDEDQDRPRRRRRRRAYQQPHRGTTILVLGILGLVVAPIILGPIAWIMGNNDMKEIRAGRMDREGEGYTNAGRICGMIATILGILGLVCCGAYFAIIMVAVGSGVR